MSGYQEMIDKIDDYVILLLDIDGTIKSWNFGLATITGFAQEDTEGKNISVLFSQKDIAHNVPFNLLAEAKNKSKAAYECSLIKKDGSFFDATILITAMYGAETLIGSSVLIRDVTGQKEHERQLKELNENLKQQLTERNEELYKNERRFKALLENTYDFISLKDAEGKVLYQSPSTERMIGYSIDEVTGKSAAEFFHPEDIADVLQRSKIAMENPGIPIWGVNRIKHKDGHYVWVEGTTTNLLDDNKIIALVGNFRDVTERKLIEETVHQSREQLKNSYNDIETLLNHTEENFIMLDLSLNILSFNRNAKENAKKYLKFDLKKGIPIFALAAPEQYENLLQLYNSVLQGERRESEVQFLNESGAKVYFNNQMKPVLSETGQVEGVFITITDVTDKKRIQTQIEFNHSNLDALINSTRDLMWSVGTDFKLITSNGKFEELIKVNHPELSNSGIYVLDEMLTQGQQQKWNSYYQRAFGGESFTVVEFLAIPSEAWFEISFYPIYKKGWVIGTACYAHDITERKRGDVKLKRSEEIRRLIMNAAMDAIVCFGPDGTITEWNPNAEKIFGWKEEEIAGKLISETIIPHKNRRLHKDGLKNYFSGSEGISLNKLEENIALNRKGDVFPIEISVIPINHQGNEFYCAFIRDITERKIVEEKLIYANRLYAFISQINQSIVHANNEQTVFKEACRIAVDYGKFKMAWIAAIDVDNQTLTVLQDGGAAPEDIFYFSNVFYGSEGPTTSVLATGKYFISNNILTDTDTVHWRQYAAARGFNSYMVLPIKKSGKITYTFNLHATEIGFFNTEEIRLLEEAAGDISFALDVLEKEKRRRRAEKKLARNEFMLQEAQQIAHLGSWEINYKTGISTWSDEACTIMGLSRQDITPSLDYYISIIHPEDSVRVNQVIRDAEENFISSSVYHRIVRRDGSIRYIYAENKFEFSHAGKPERLHGILHDITQQKLAEEALAQSEANLRLIMDMLPHAIFVKASDGRYLFANKSCSALYGLEPAQLLNRRLKEILPSGNKEEFYHNQDIEVIKTNKPKIIPEQEFIDVNGERRIFHSIKMPYTTAGEREQSILGISLDITERKKAEVERMKMIVEIVQRNKELEQFSYIISHNLRSPVANIIGITDLLQSGLDAKEAEEMFNELSISATKLDSVIKDINSVLQVKSNVNDNKELVILSELIDDVALSIESIVVITGTEIITDFSAVGEILIFKSYLYSIFYNLISNSIKYKQPGIAPVINITSFVEGEHIGFIFRDNGLGIDLDRSGNQVFGLYKRFHMHVEGKGMGLFMVKRQVESLGGEIFITSELNKGTEFRIVFNRDEAMAN
ncbi:MAG: PAS domain S-box protein [Taibaiella sp.]|nr:PAS domain S-box protein [Taibaiella sp.]